ncbi:hypothetical protein EXIGLDRAFT_717337 [Exidia glandulosa HHB12029]|uniref:Large ribosomal subunit protein mL49 n=1 Tax=Exidia glandulosa HHB12029 TaxID=1314781 RepID=A0A165IG76_EXIGL|nr:hypothetical protein EXIGLDRAFT_717337 [Exidia glandulosa HHB12029]
MSLFFRRALVTRAAKYPYFVNRNPRGALPVYSDWKLNRTKYIVEIKNIEGDATALKADLQATLFPDEERASRLKVDVVRGSQIKLTGLAGHYRDEVFEWLIARGF